MLSLTTLLAACGGGGGDPAAGMATIGEVGTTAALPEALPEALAEADADATSAALAVRGATPRPYTGVAAALPGVVNAVAFDLGGQNVAYRDLVAGNAGGQYRSAEDVDIVASSDSVGGGWTVNNIQTGEWLHYTVAVATGGTFDLELRVSSAMNNSAFHVEIDGVNVTGRIAVPNGGSWHSFQWVGKPGIALGAGTHRVKIVSDQEYFNLNAFRFVATPSSSARLLFKSGFEGATALAAPLLYGNGAWQDVSGTDSESGFTWPARIWGGSSRLQLIAGDGLSINALTLGNYVANQIQNVGGRSGSTTRALYSEVKQSVYGSLVNWDSTQNDFVLQPSATGQGDLYIGYWLKFQPDLLERMTVGNWAGRVVSDWKTGGDYRLLLNVYGDGANRRLYWHMKGDNVANGGYAPQVFWELTNTTVPVPVGRWFRVEMFVHRSLGADGRVWVAVDGQKLFDRMGSNIGAGGLPWNRIMAFLNYSSGQQLPAYQWVDDLEIWDGFPAGASPH